MKRNGFYRMLIALAVAILIGFTTYYYAQSPDGQASAPLKPAEALQKPSLSSIGTAKAFSQAFVDVSRKVTPSIVMIMNEEKLQNRMGDDAFRQMFPDDFFGNLFNFTPEQREQVQKTVGSGVIMSQDGYIITNNHVVDHSTRLQVTLPDGKRTSARIIGKDPKTDLALLQVDAKNLQAVQFGKYDDINVGEWVLAIGSPFGEALQRTVTAGIISAKGRSNVGIADYEDFLQTDAAINPGNSGGALVDLDGKLIGINTAIVSSNGSNAGVGFAIPINIVQNVIQQLKANGRVVRGYMGVTIQDVSPEMQRTLHLSDGTGAVISEVVKKSPADEAGLKSYDVILSVNGVSIHDSAQLRNLVSTFKPGTRLQVEYMRDSNRRTASITVGEMKADRVEASSEPADLQLGMDYQNLTPRLSRELRSEQTEGVVVTEVRSGSAAEEAGLQRGDIIFEVNRQPVPSVNSFENLIRQTKDSSVLLAVERQGSTFFVSLQLR